MDDEERKLQIKLAQLQTDVQIWLAMCFGGVAILASMEIVFLQEFVSSPEGLLKYSFLAAIVTGYIGIVIVAAVSTKQMLAKRTEMDEL